MRNSGVQTEEQKNLYRAAKVIASDVRISSWLRQNDPKALEQLLNALAPFEPGIGNWNRKALSRMSRNPNTRAFSSRT